MKIIEGKPWDYYGTYPTKKEAEKFAKRIREWHNLRYRIIKVTAGYSVYTRPPEHLI